MITHRSPISFTCCPFLRRYAVFVALEPEEVASRFIREVQRADMNPGRASGADCDVRAAQADPMAHDHDDRVGNRGDRRRMVRLSVLSRRTKPRWRMRKLLRQRRRLFPMRNKRLRKPTKPHPANVAAPMAVPSTAIVPEAAPSSRRSGTRSGALGGSCAYRGSARRGLVPLQKPSLKSSMHSHAHSFDQIGIRSTSIINAELSGLVPTP